jgi:hypothetical protein
MKPAAPTGDHVFVDTSSSEQPQQLSQHPHEPEQTMILMQGSLIHKSGWMPFAGSVEADEKGALLVRPESMGDVRTIFELIFDVPVPNILLAAGPGSASESVDPMIKALGHITKSYVHS